MYRPYDRARAKLMLMVTMLLFVGALALPFLVERDVVRLHFGDEEGLQVQGGGLEDIIETKEDDGLLVRPSRVLVSSPSSTGSATFDVTWDNVGPDAGATYAYHVQYGVVGSGDDGETEWQDWFRLRQSDQPRTAAFTGDPGVLYQFRGRACTLGIDCGAWSETAETHVLPEAPRPEVVLDLTAREPAASQIVQGKVAVAWHYDHRGPGSALIDVTLRPVGAAAETPLYSGGGFSTVWDTSRQDDGSYVVRIRLSDGVHTVEHEVPVRVQNAAPQQTGLSHLDDGSEEAEETGPKKPDGNAEEATALPIAMTVAALVVVATSARRRMA